MMLDRTPSSLPDIDGVVYSDTALLLPEGLSFERWASVGLALQAMLRSCQWWVGDWFNYGESHFREHSAQAVALATGHEEKTVWNCASVARRYSTSRRREVLSFSHHAELAGLSDKDQDTWLDLAEAEGLTRRELRIRLSEARSRGLTSPPTLLSLEESGVPTLDPGLPILIQQADAEDLPLEDGSVDLIVTSPPYDLGIDYADSQDDQGYDRYLDQVRAWAREFYRVSAPQGRICVNVPLDVTRGGTRPMAADWTDALMQAGWQYRTTIVWNEGNVNKSVARGSVDSPSAPHVMAPVEVILVLHKGEWNLRRIGPHDLTHDEWLTWTNGLWTFPGASSPDHPAPFPEELPRRCISLFSFTGDTVLDPFVGSGTTAAVAARLGRRVYGFDISPRYVALARGRVAREALAA